ncbi:7572_t:CDS:1, partial [Cetraspora pellucida]
NYLRSLENKVEMYEKAYAEYQNENRLLKGELALLKRRLSRFENYGFDGGLGIASSDVQLPDKMPDNKNANSCCNVVNAIYSVPQLIEDNQIYHGVDEHKDNSTHRDVIVNSCHNERIYLQDYSLSVNNDSSSFTQKPYSPSSNDNLSSFMQDYDEQSNSRNRPRSPTHSLTSIDSVDGIVNDSSIFSKGHLCFCDDSEISGQSRISPGNNSIATVIGQKTSILPRQCTSQEFATTTRQTLPSPDEPQWSLSHEHYFNNTLTPMSSFSLMDSERGT